MKCKEYGPRSYSNTLELAGKFWLEETLQRICSTHQWRRKSFTSPLMTRPKKLEGLPLESLSSQVLEFEGKARATQEDPSDASLLV